MRRSGQACPDAPFLCNRSPLVHSGADHAECDGALGQAIKVLRCSPLDEPCITRADMPENWIDGSAAPRNEGEVTVLIIGVIIFVVVIGIPYVIICIADSAAKDNQTW